LFDVTAGVLLFDDTDQEGTHFAGAFAVDFVGGPGEFEMDTGAEDFATGDGSAEAFEEGLFTGVDKDDAGGEEEEGGLGEDEPGGGALEELVEPGIGDLEAELVIEGLGEGGEEAGGLGQEADEAAFVHDAGFDAALDAGAVEFEGESDQGFDRQDSEDHGESAGEEEIDPGEPGFHGGDTEGDQEADGSTEKDVSGDGSEESLTFQLGQAGGVFPEEEEDQ
jgi:hypothetical protein